MEETIDSYDVALSTYDGTTQTLSNFRAATALNKYPALTQLKLKLLQSVACGVLPSTTNNAIVGITASQHTNDVSLAVDPQVTPLAPAVPTAASVGVASGQILAANTSRRHLVLVNTSGNTISIAFGANAAVLNSGITLMPSGGSYEMSSAYGNVTTQAINAIAGGAASNLSIQEDN